MKTNNTLKTTMLSALFVAGASSCSQRKPYVEMPPSYIPEAVQTKVDSIAEASKKTLKNKDYKFYGNDTIRLPKNFITKTNKFINTMNNKAYQADGRTQVGIETYMQTISTGKSITAVSRTRAVYEDNHIKHIGVIANPKIFTTDSTDMYVPVKYYGIPNPEIKEKH